MEESKLIEKLFNKEREAGLYEDLYLGFPFWRLFRYRTRLGHLQIVKNFKARTAPSLIVGKPKIKLTSGFWKYIFKKNVTICIPFNRLVFNNGIYLDKFIDPAIESSSLNKDNYIILDPASYIGNYPRLHKDHTISNETRNISFIILRFLLSLIVPVLYKKKLYKLLEKVSLVYKTPNNIKNIYNKQLTSFLTFYLYYFLWFKLIRPRRVLLVYREGCFPILAICKKLHIPVAEFQHGITLDHTMSYTGSYDKRIDPDYFFIFGEYWKGPQFGMELDRIFNIGWPYRKYNKDQIMGQLSSKMKEVLVISSSNITDYILDALKVLGSGNENVEFHIRLHPCESYNESQKEKLNDIKNAKIVDNIIDCSEALLRYNYVIGEISSVIFEALSYGCKSAIINMCGLKAPIEKPGIKDSFFIINNKDDFRDFLDEGFQLDKKGNEFYSEFNGKQFVNFLNLYM